MFEFLRRLLPRARRAEQLRQEVARDAQVDMSTRQTLESIERARPTLGRPKGVARTYPSRRSDGPVPYDQHPHLTVFYSDYSSPSSPSQSDCGSSSSSSSSDSGGGGGCDGGGGGGSD